MMNVFGVGDGVESCNSITGKSKLPWQITSNFS